MIECENRDELSMASLFCALNGYEHAVEEDRLTFSAPRPLRTDGRDDLDEYVGAVQEFFRNSESREITR